MVCYFKEVGDLLVSVEHRQASNGVVFSYGCDTLGQRSYFKESILCAINGLWIMVYKESFY